MKRLLLSTFILLSSYQAFSQTDSTRRYPVQSIKREELKPLSHSAYEAGRQLQAGGGLLLGGIILTTGSIAGAAFYNSDYKGRIDDNTGDLIQFFGGVGGLVLSTIGYIKLIKAGKHLKESSR